MTYMTFFPFSDCFFVPFFFLIASSFVLCDTGFAVSALASNWERLGKPFNPLLGETYEYRNSEFRVICEQVKFHFVSNETVTN